MNENNKNNVIQNLSKLNLPIKALALLKKSVQNAVKNQGNKKKVNVVKKSQPMKPSLDYGHQLGSILNEGYGKTLSMYPGTLSYAKVYSDPFVIDSARIPVFPIVSSSLERYYASGKGQTNANGNGWISVYPPNLATNDLQAVYYSDSASGDPMNNTFQFAMGSSPHTSASFTEVTGTYAVRVVALGIRVRYTGTTLNAAGTMVTAQASPLGDSLSGQTYTTMKQIPGFKEYTFKDTAWHSITRHVETTDDTAFIEFDGTRWVFPDSTAHPNDDNFRIGIYISGANGVQPFEWEVVGHYELLGTNLVRRGVTTPDTPGFEHVVGTFAERRQRDSTTRDHNVGGTWNTLVGFLKESAKSVIPLIPSVLSKLLL